MGARLYGRNSKNWFSLRTKLKLFFKTGVTKTGTYQIFLTHEVKTDQMSVVDRLSFLHLYNLPACNTLLRQGQH